MSPLVRHNQPLPELIVQADGDVGKITKALRHADPVVREAAAWALGQIGARGTANDVVAALRDQDERVRGTAALSLGLMDDASAAPALMAALEDSNPDVARYALVSLIRLNAAPIELLLRSLHHDDWGVRQGAAKSLGRLREPRALEALLSTLANDASDSVCGEAAESLGKIVATLPKDDPMRASALRALEAALSGARSDFIRMRARGALANVQRAAGR